MKTIMKILFLIFIPAVFISIFFIVHIFFYDPFIQFAPKNTFFYSYANLSSFNVLTKNFNNIINQREDIKEFIKSNINNDTLYKINNYYKHKIGLFLSKDNNNINIYIALEKNNIENKDINLDINEFKNLINKYFGYNIKLESKFIGNYLFITNNINSLENITKNRFVFYKDYLYLIYKNKELNKFLFKNIIDGYINTEILNNELGENKIDIFNKKYSLFSLKYNNKKIIFDINNLKNINSELNNIDINNLNKPNLIIDNININNLYDRSIVLFKNSTQLNKKVSFLEKYFNDENININNFKNIFDNNGKIFLTFKDDINVNNIKDFLIILNLNKFNNYYDQIRNFESVFLREYAKDNLILKEDEVSKEKILDYNNLNFEEIKIDNKLIDQKVKYLKLKNGNIYFSYIYDKGYFIISNSLEMLENLYYKNNNYNVIEVNNINSNIELESHENNLIIRL